VTIAIRAARWFGVMHARAMPRREKSAGASSQRKYNQLTRSWRRRNWKLFLGLALVCVLVGVATFAAAQRWPSQGWTLGMIAGLFFAAFVILRMSPPGWIENWQVGAWGEESTAKALRALEGEGWIVMHDLDAAGHGNVDHIAVGPGGVFVLDSKNLPGSVTVDGRGVTVRRLDDPSLSYQHPGSRHLVDLARQTHDRTLRSSQVKAWVTPVMVLWAEFPQRVVEGRCTYVHGDEVVAWLRSRPAKMSPARVRVVAEAVRAGWESALTVEESAQV
jgi:nuclease-like protein